jgi:aspartyl protease family protein
MTTPSTFGKIFINISWILLLAGLGYLFQQMLDHNENPNQNPLSLKTDTATEVVLTRNQQHHYVANGYINNFPVTFLVDTGATNVSIGADLAERIGLTRGYEGIAYTANGNTTTYATTLSSLNIGDIRFEKVRASITMGMRGDEVLLGMSALKDVELTHKNGKLTIRQYN